MPAMAWPAAELKVELCSGEIGSRASSSDSRLYEENWRLAVAAAAMLKKFELLGPGGWCSMGLGGGERVKDDDEELLATCSPPP